MVCGFFNSFKLSKKFKFFFTTCTTRTRCECSYRPRLEEDADEATGAESSSDEAEEVAPPAPSSGCHRGRRRRALKKKSRVDEVGGEWKKEDNTPIDFPKSYV